MIARLWIRFVYKTSLFFLRYLQFFSVRKYMVLFNCLLKWRGMVFTGVPRFISPLARFDNFSKVQIGDRVVISDNVIFLNHDYSLTTALRAIGFENPVDIAFEEKIIVGDNVFVGMNSVLLPGVVIGSNVIIGAGSVVRGVVKSNSVVIGNPASSVSGIDELALRWKTKMEFSELIVDKV